MFVCIEGLTCGMELQRTEQQNRTVFLNDVSMSCKEICLTFYNLFLPFEIHNEINAVCNFGHVK